MIYLHQRACPYIADHPWDRPLSGHPTNLWYTVMRDQLSHFADLSLLRIKSLRYRNRGEIVLSRQTWVDGFTVNPLRLCASAVRSFLRGE